MSMRSWNDSMKKYCVNKTAPVYSYDNSLLKFVCEVKKYDLVVHSGVATTSILATV